MIPKAVIRSGPFFFIFILLLNGCFKSNKDLATSTVVEVNEDRLTAREFSQILAKKLKAFDALAAKDVCTNIHRAKEALIRDFIISSRLQQHAKKSKKDVTEEEVTAEFNDQKGLSRRLTFKASLISEGQTIESWKKALASTLLEKKPLNSCSPAMNRNLGRALKWRRKIILKNTGMNSNNLSK